MRDRLQRARERAVTGLEIDEYVTEWDTGEPVLRKWTAKIKESDYDEEFRHLGYTASLSGSEKDTVAKIKVEAKNMGKMICGSRSSRRWALLDTTHDYSDIICSDLKCKF